MKDYRHAKVRETREDDRSVALHLDANKFAESNRNRTREQARFPKGLTVQSRRSGPCGFQAEFQGNGHGRTSHHRSKTASSSTALASLLYRA